MKNWSEYIHSAPVIKGTRITVELIVERLGFGQTPENLLVSYLYFSKEVIW